jgi:hypothetical protein
MVGFRWLAMLLRRESEEEEEEEEEEVMFEGAMFDIVAVPSQLEL